MRWNIFFTVEKKKSATKIRVQSLARLMLDVFFLTDLFFAILIIFVEDDKNKSCLRFKVDKVDKNKDIKRLNT